MNKRSFVVMLRNKFDADIIDIIFHIRYRQKKKQSAVVRDLLREYRDRGYRTEAEWKEAVEMGEVELNPFVERTP